MRIKVRYVIASGVPALVAALAITYFVRGAGFFGTCPYTRDPRAYAQHGCFTEYVSGATTLDGALAHYDVPMPTSASAVRFYLEPGAFNGGDAFYLKFSASPAQIRSFMQQLGTQSANGTAVELWAQQQQGYDDPVPWTFDSAYSAYAYSKTIGSGNDAESVTGTVIVSAEMTTAYVFVDT